jgi:hypothetical protein
MKTFPLCLVLLVALVFVSAPSGAVPLQCESICKCTISCDHVCRLDGFNITCGSYGICIDECPPATPSGLVDTTSQSTPALFAPEVPPWMTSAPVITAKRCTA